MENQNLFSSGARLVWRHSRIVWWVFFVNLILAWFSSGPVKAAFSPFLDHSLASKALIDRFDMATMIELVRDPGIQMHAYSTASIHFAMIFLIYMIFIDGGVLTVYREDRKLTKAEFFEMSGGYFWRMLRTVLLSIIPFALLGAALNALTDWADTLSDNAANDRTGFRVLVAGVIVLWIVFLFVRAWFDVAQSLIVAENDRGALRCTWRALKIAIRNITTLLSAYISIHIVGIVSMLVLIGIWSRIPHAAIGLSFIVLEILVLIQIAVRLWMKAACMNWLENRTLVVATPVYELAPQVTTQFPPTPEML